MNKRWIRSFAAVGALAGSLQAQAPGEATASRWGRELAETRDLLAAGEAERALEAARGLHEELIQALKAGGSANELAAVAVAQLALAEAGASTPGGGERAAWHLEVAAILNPAFGDADFAQFGRIGASLREARERWRADDPPEGEVLPAVPVAGLAPPEMREAPHMVFRASREVLEALDPELRVSFVVDRAGRVRRPSVSGRLDNPAPVLLSLDLLRDWRFEPAVLGGQTVPVRYAVDLPLTEGVARRARWDLALWRIACLMAGEELRAAREAAGRLLLEVESSPASSSRELAGKRARELLAAIDRRLADT